MLFHIPRDVGHGVEVFNLFVGDLDAELIRQGGDHIHNVEAVGAEIFHDIAFGGDLFGVDVELDRKSTRLNSSHQI